MIYSNKKFKGLQDFLKQRRLKKWTIRKVLDCGRYWEFSNRRIIYTVFKEFYEGY